MRTGRSFGPAVQLGWHPGANASHAGTGELAEPGPLACASQGDEVRSFPERTCSSGLSPPAEVRKVGLVDLAFAGTSLMTVGHGRIIAGQRHKEPPRGTPQITACAINLG
jgi:hypothetical protein